MKSLRIIVIVSAAVAFAAVVLDGAASVFDAQVGSMMLLVVASIIAGSLLLLTTGFVLVDALRDEHRKMAAQVAELTEKLDAALEAVEERGFSDGMITGIRSGPADSGVVRELVPRKSR